MAEHERKAETADPDAPDQRPDPDDPVPPWAESGRATTTGEGATSAVDTSGDPADGDDGSEDGAGSDDERGRVEAAGRAVVEAGSIHAGRADIALEMNKIEKYFENLYLGYGDGGPRELTYGELEAFAAEQLEPFDEIPVLPEAQMRTVVERIVAGRIVLLVGPRGMGKGACALAAGARVMRADTEVSELLTTGALGRDTKLRLETLFEAKGRFAKRIVVLEDAFDQGNVDLVRFAERLDEARARGLAELLRSVGSYLVLTSDHDRIPSRGDRLGALGVLVRLDATPHEILVQALHRRALLGVDSMKEDAAATCEAVLEEHGERIAGQLGSVPRILRFVDGYLGAVAEGSLSLGEALERVDDLEHWLLHELPGQQDDGWSFVIALTLASSVSTAAWVSWLPFQKLWREVAGALARELGLNREETPRPASSLIVDSRFLGRTRAVIRNMPFPVGEVVRFRNPGDGERLWRVLLGPGRQVLSVLVDRLRELTETDDPVVRQLAAQALGRAGVLDPRSLFFPLATFWSRSKEERRHDSLGALFTGVLASGDAAYRAGCLHRLRHVTGSRSADQVRAGVQALGQIGQIDLPLAMKEMRRIFEGALGEVVESVEVLNRELRRLADQSEEARKLDRGAVEALHRHLLERLTPQLFDDHQAVVLGSVQYALVGLCFGRDPLQVFAELTGWMEGRKEGVAPLVSLLTLRDKGILDVVERFRVMAGPPGDEDGADGGQRRPCSRTLLALEQDGDLLVLRDFLEALFRGAEPLPAWFRKPLRRTLRSVLARWGRDAAEQEWLRPRVSGLLAALLDSSDPELKEMVFHLLKEDRSFQTDELELGPVASAALKAQPPRAAPEESG